MAKKLTSSPLLNREISFECAICLQPCLQPVQLPCSHVFCFLCAKGIAMQSQKCALCRSSIPQDFITKPTLFTKPGEHLQQSSRSNESYVWYYQGYNGWWQYDERTCTEIEAAYNQKLPSVDVLVAGSVYVIDFENLIQYQRHRDSRKRKIKRDFVTANKKGVAGLETKAETVVPQPSSASDASMSSACRSPVEHPVDDFSDIQLPLANQNVGRQLPLGADDQNIENLTSTVASSTSVAPGLVRVSSDTTNILQQHATPVLCRYNTYSHHQTNPTPDDPME